MDRCHLYQPRDVYERNQQVLLMTTVFGLATHVISWYGGPKEDIVVGSGGIVELFVLWMLNLTRLHHLCYDATKKIALWEYQLCKHRIVSCATAEIRRQARLDAPLSGLFDTHGCLNWNFGASTAITNEKIEKLRCLAEYGPKWRQAGFGNYQELALTSGASMSKDTAWEREALANLSIRSSLSSIHIS